MQFLEILPNFIHLHYRVTTDECSVNKIALLDAPLSMRKTSCFPIYFSYLNNKEENIYYKASEILLIKVDWLSILSDCTFVSFSCVDAFI